MREHLYRGQRRDTKEWVYGSLIGKDVIVGPIIDFNEEYFNTEFWWKVIPETVGQYIGLQDSKGIKIFENDILNGPFRTGSFGKSIRTKMFNFLVNFYINIGGTVHYTDMPKDYGNFRFCPYLTECTIVGNLADNPELLQNK